MNHTKLKTQYCNLVLTFGPKVRDMLQEQSLLCVCVHSLPVFMALVINLGWFFPGVQKEYITYWGSGSAMSAIALFSLPPIM